MSEAKPGAAQSTNSTESSKVPAAPRSRARFLGPVLSVAGLALTALYPLIIYALLSAGLMWPCALVVVLAAAALWRVRRTKISLAALVVAAVLAALTLATDKALALKLYPVLVNLCWLALFCSLAFFHACRRALCPHEVSSASGGRTALLQARHPRLVRLFHRQRGGGA